MVNPGQCPLCSAELEAVEYLPLELLESRRVEAGAEQRGAASQQMRELLALNSKAAIAESEREIAEGVIEDLATRIDELEDELEDCHLAVIVAERLAKGGERISLEEVIRGLDLPEEDKQRFLGRLEEDRPEEADE